MRGKLLKILGGLSAAYPTFKLSEETVEMYIKLLSDLPYSSLQAAALKHMATSTYFPTIAELRQAAMELSIRHIPLAAEAWEEVVRNFKKVGYTGKPEFSNPLIIKAVQAMGGWVDLCQSENGMVDRAHFLKIYESYRNREVENEKVAPVIKNLLGEVTKSIAG